MKRSSKPRKVVLLSDKLAVGSRSGKKTIPLLPAINFISSAGSDQGLMQLSDGGYRRIFEIDGFSLVSFHHNAADLEAKFKELIDGLNCNLQLLIASRPYPIGSWEDYQGQANPVDNDYLRWYLDYSYKWFSRVCDCAHIPRRSFYAVLSSPEDAGKTKTNDQKRKAFERAAEDCIKQLTALGQNPRAVVGEDARLLLSQYFLSPPVQSEKHTIDKLAACLSDSTIMEPEIVEDAGWIKIGDTFHASCAITHLPAEIASAWLYWPVIETTPYTVSIHLMPCEQKQTVSRIQEKYARKKLPADLSDIASGASRAIDVSVYISTYGKTEGELKERLELVRTNFLKKGAPTGAAAGRQSALWRANLPIGLNEPRLCHRISSQAASAFWPCVFDVPSQDKGIFVGYGRASLSPVFINPKEQSDYLVVASKGDEAHSLMSLLAMKYLSSGMRVLYVGASEHPQFLGSVLGPELCKTVEVDKTGKPDRDPVRSFCHLRWQKNNELDPQSTKKLFDLVRGWSAKAGSGKVIFIEDISGFLENASSTRALKRLLADADEKGIRIFMAVKPKYLARLAALKHSFENKIVFRPSAAEVTHIKKHLDKNYCFTPGYPRAGKDNYVCALIKGGALWFVSLLWSPMDGGLLARSHIYGQSNAKLKARRLALYKDVRRKNPKLSECDGWRQAIYYFGLQQG